MLNSTLVLLPLSRSLSLSLPLPRSISFSLALALLLSSPLAAQTQAQAAPKASAADVAWLTGCWELDRGKRHVVEHWTAPEGGTLLGVSRTVSDGKTVEYEFLLIRERGGDGNGAGGVGAGAGGGLEYVAKPSGQPEAVFAATRVTADEVLFENPQHDFPQRIRYKKQPDGGLAARIEGTLNGAARGIDFAYRAATCGR
jgi:hypothetical protein